MNELEQSPALPRGFCDACLQHLTYRSLPTADGGKLIGGYCTHNRVVAVCQHRPDGLVSVWKLQTPATEEDLHTLMAMYAGALAGIVDADNARLASLN